MKKMENLFNIQTVIFDGKEYPVREVEFSDGIVTNVATMELKNALEAYIGMGFQRLVEMEGAVDFSLSDLAFSIDNEIVYYAESAEFCLSVEELEAIIYN